MHTAIPVAYIRRGLQYAVINIHDSFRDFISRKQRNSLGECSCIIREPEYLSHIMTECWVVESKTEKQEKTIRNVKGLQDPCQTTDLFNI